MYCVSFLLRASHAICGYTMNMFNYFIDIYLNLSLGIQFVLKDVFFWIAVVILLNNISLKTPWKKWLIMLGETAALYLGYFIFGSVFYLVFGINNLHIFVNLFILIFAVLFLRDESLVSRLCTVVVLFTFNLASSYLGSNVVYLYEQSGNAAGPFIHFMACVVNAALLALCTVFLKWKSLGKFPYVPWSGCAFIVGYSAIVIVLPFVWGNSISYIRGLFLTIILVAIEIAAYAMYYSFVSVHQARMKSGVREQMKKRDVDSILINKASYEQIIEIRHEMKHDFSYIESLVKEQKYDELREFVKEKNVDEVDMLSLPVSGNDVIDSAILSETYKAKSSGIRIEAKLAVPPVIPVKGYKLYSILMNLMDNAIESLQRDQIEDPYVYVNIRMVKSILFIKIENPIKDTSDTIDLTTTKKGKPELHGYGTSIVKKYVEENNGAVTYNKKDGKFVVDVMMSFDDKE